MKHASSHLLLIASLMLGSLCPTDAVFGQSSDYYELVQSLNRSQVYSSSVVIPGEGGVGQVGISFRIPHALLYFVQADKKTSDSTYRANVEVEVDVYRDGERVAQKVWQKEPTVSNYSSVEAHFEDIEGAVWFPLEPGTYTYRLKVMDVISEQSARTQSRKLTVPEQGAPGLTGSILAKNLTVNDKQRTVDTYSLSGDAAYGKDAWAVIPVVLPPTISPDSVKLFMSLRQVKSDVSARLMKKRQSQVVRPHVEGLVEDLPRQGAVLRHDTLGGHELLPIAGIEVDESEPGSFVLRGAESDQETNRYVLIIDLNGRELKNEHFTFDLSVETPNGELARYSSTFASYWREKPYSLYDLDLAIDQLSFMTEPGIVDQVKDGTVAERKQKFEEFWAQRDPTPGTPFNELMAEYYRRIDHAADEFRTELKPVRAFDKGGGSVPDGLKSDRARVYIVHGPPNSKARENPRRGLVREKWNYEDGRTFIFEALSKFNPFRLVEQYKYAGR